MAYACYAHSLTGEVRERTQVGQRIVLAVGRGYHADTCWSAVHLVKLTGK